MTERKLKDSEKKSANQALSDAEVGRFLKGLATVYRDRRTGNLALAEGLARVAENLVRSAPPKEALQEKVSSTELLQLDAEGIVRYISDEMKSKTELIELATVRFSMPRGKLLRMNLSELRDAIRASMQHEESLRIITQEAEQKGATRRS